MADRDVANAICDCHIHSFAKSAAAGTGAYTPPQKDVSDYVREAMPLGIARAIVVQASVDGTDNSRLVDVLRSRPRIELRGVGMIDPDTADLASLHAAGLRAIRVQDRARLGESDLDRLPALARCAASVGWHIELNTEPRRLAEIAVRLPSLPEGVPLVLDHIAHVDPERPSEADALFRLLDTGRIWVKLSPTRVSRRIGDYGDLAAIVARIGAEYPLQCVWGSDWPHVMTEPPLPEIAPMLALCREVLSAAQFRACMWSNAERLYGF